MNSMFNSLDEMIDNYEERKILNFKKDKLIIDTCRVTDSLDPFETAVSHPDYKNGEWIVVETYTTKELAKKGHFKWVEKMISKETPSELIDVSTCWSGELLRIQCNGKIIRKKNI